MVHIVKQHNKAHNRSVISFSARLLRPKCMMMVSGEHHPESRRRGFGGDFVVCTYISSTLAMDANAVDGRLVSSLPRTRLQISR